MKAVAFPAPLIGASIPVGVGAVEDFLRLGLGNVVLLALPDDRQEAIAVMRLCRERGVYVMAGEVMRRDQTGRQWHNPNYTVEDFHDIYAAAGKYFIGRYTIGEAGGMLYWPQEYVVNAKAGMYDSMPLCRNMDEAHDEYVKTLAKMIERDRREVADTALFDVDSSMVFPTHVEAGLDGLCLEMLPGDPLLMTAAIRGAARESGLPWGIHIAMGWYGGERVDRLWLLRWKMSLYWSYLAGAEFIYPETGHYEHKSADGKTYSFASHEMKQVRRELRELYQFTKFHSRTKAFPRTPLGLISGNGDGNPGLWNPFAWGQYGNGRKWEASAPEKGWRLADKLFCHESPFDRSVTGEVDLSGNPPSGQYDVVPHYSKHFSDYRQICFVGYNLMTDDLYRRLIAYVRGGGALLIGLAHFNVNSERNGKIKLFKDGDLTELCGCRVERFERSRVRGVKFFAASSWERFDFPVKKPNCDPFYLGRRTAARLKSVANNVRVLAGFSGLFDDTAEGLAARPALIEHRLGKGIVHLVCCSDYPGADGMAEFYELLLRKAAQGASSQEPFTVVAADTVRYAVWDSECGQTVYALNTGFDVPSGARVVYKKATSVPVLLAPGEFRLWFFSNGILIVPESDPHVSLAGNFENGFAISSRIGQKIRIENLDSMPRKIKIGTETLDLTTGGSAEISVPGVGPEIPAEPDMVPEKMKMPY